MFFSGHWNPTGILALSRLDTIIYSDNQFKTNRVFVFSCALISSLEYAPMITCNIGKYVPLTTAVSSLSGELSMNKPQKQDAAIKAKSRLKLGTTKKSTVSRDFKFYK